MPTSRDLLKQGDAAFSARNYADATALYQRAVELGNLEKDEESAIEGLSQMARALLAQDRREDGRPWLERAMARARPEMPLAWTRMLGVRGRFEWKDGRLAESTRTFEDAYAFCMERGLHERAIDAAHMVAITGTPEQQLEWGKRGIAAAEKGGVEGWLGPLWNNLGYTYETLGRNEEALGAYQKARHYHWKLGDEQAKLVADWAMGHALRVCGRHPQAASWLRPVLAWAERRQAERRDASSAEWVGLACRELGETEAERGRATEGLALMRRARAELEAAKMPEWDAAGFAKLAQRIAEMEAAQGGPAGPAQPAPE